MTADESVRDLLDGATAVGTEPYTQLPGNDYPMPNLQSAMRWRPASQWQKPIPPWEHR